MFLFPWQKNQLINKVNCAFKRINKNRSNLSSDLFFIYYKFCNDGFYGTIKNTVV